MSNTANSDHNIKKKTKKQENPKTKRKKEKFIWLAVDISK